MLTPDKVSVAYARKRPCISVLHEFPDEWDERECSLHRWDECPCVPQMSQIFCTCGRDHGGYRWKVKHVRALS